MVYQAASSARKRADAANVEALKLEAIAKDLQAQFESTTAHSSSHLAAEAENIQKTQASLWQRAAASGSAVDLLCTVCTVVSVLSVMWR